MAERTVDVLVPVAVDSPYSYRIPANLALSPGDLVAVPFGNRRVIGAVWPSQQEVSAQTKLKPVSAKLDFPRLPQELMRLVDWVADYTLAPRGMVLRMALRFDPELGEARARVGVRLVGEPPPLMTAARGRVIALLSDGLVRPKVEAAKEAGVSASVVDGLIDEGDRKSVV